MILIENMIIFNFIFNKNIQYCCGDVFVLPNYRDITVGKILNIHIELFIK